MNYDEKMFEMVKESLSNAIITNALIMKRWPIVEIGKKYNRATLNIKWNMKSPKYKSFNDKAHDDIMNKLPIYAILESIFGVGKNKDYCLQKEEDRYDVTYYIDDMVHAKLLNNLEVFNEKRKRW